MSNGYHRLKQFLTYGIWDVVPSTLAVWWRLPFQAFRFVAAVGRGFMRDRCNLHASALTYYTLMALMPVLVLALALGRVFGGDDIVRRQLEEHLSSFLSQLALQSAGINEAANEASQAFAEQLQIKAIQFFDQINTISFGTLGGIGAAILIWMVITLLGRVEASFNLIYGVPQPRSLWRKFTDYLSVVLILPFLATAASTVPILDIIAHGADTVGGAVMADTVRAAVGASLLRKSVILFISTLAFTFLLIFMPNTRIRFVPGLIGGFITAILFNGWLIVCAKLQVGIVKYSALYGGFAILPILLMWVYTSWELILLGAEIVFALQHGATCRMEAAAGRASAYTRFLLAVAFCAEAGRTLIEKGGAFNAEEFALQRQISARLSQDVLGELTRAGFLAAIENQVGFYLPCRDFSKVRVTEIAKSVLADGTQPNDLGLQRIDRFILDLGPQLLSAIDNALLSPIADLTPHHEAPA